MSSLPVITEQPIPFTPNNRNRVVSRNVKRYFLYGKGFAREIDAYRAMARHELDREIWRRADEKRKPMQQPWLKLPWTTQSQIIRDLEKQVLAEMFPPKCQKRNSTNLPNLFHGQHTDFCRGCRWEYLNVRARELQEKAK